MSKRAKSKKHNPKRVAPSPAPHHPVATSDEEDATTNPNKLIAVLFGIPFAVIVAALAFRLLVN